MKLLYVHHSPSTGGASNSLKFLISGLKSKNIDIHIICPPGKVFENFLELTPNVYEIKGLPLLMATSGTNFALIRALQSFRYIGQLKKVYDLAREIKPDIIHLNDIGQLILAKKLKKLGFKVVMHARVAINTNYRVLTKYTVYTINKYIDHVFAIDGSVKNKLKGVKRIKIIYNPLQPNTKILKKTNLSSVTNCLFLANFLKHKGISVLIKTIIQLKENKNIIFYVAGSNVRPKSFYKSLFGKLLHYLNIYPNYEKILNEVKLKYNLNNIILLGQISDINTVLSKTDIILLPTFMNEPSRSIFEAGSLGIPSIISLKDKVEDVVEDNYNGIIIDENSSNQLTNAILKLSSDKDLRFKMGVNSSKRFNKLNNLETSAASVYDIYTSVINNQ